MSPPPAGFNALRVLGWRVALWGVIMILRMIERISGEWAKRRELPPTGTWGWWLRLRPILVRYTGRRFLDNLEDWQLAKLNVWLDEVSEGVMKEWKSRGCPGECREWMKG